MLTATVALVCMQVCAVRNWVAAHIFPVHKFLDSAAYRCGPLPATPCNNSDTASDYSSSGSSEYGSSPTKSHTDYSPVKC